MYIVYLRRIVYLLLLPKGPSELQTMYYSITAQAEEGVARGRTQLPHYCEYRRFAQCALLRNVASIAGNWLKKCESTVRRDVTGSYIIRLLKGNGTRAARNYHVVLGISLLVCGQHLCRINV